MSHNSSFLDFDQSDDFIIKAPPKNTEPLPSQPTRSRFTILADINEATNTVKNVDQPSLLSSYLRDLHDLQAQAQKQSTKVSNNSQDVGEQKNDKNKKQAVCKKYDEHQMDMKRKKGFNIASDKIQNFTNSRGSSRNSRRVSEHQHQQQKQFVNGIFLQRHKINLLQQIDSMQLIIQQSYRNSGQNRNSLKVKSGEAGDDMLFEKALRHRNTRTFK